MLSEVRSESRTDKSVTLKLRCKSEPERCACSSGVQVLLRPRAERLPSSDDGTLAARGVPTVHRASLVFLRWVISEESILARISRGFLQQEKRNHVQKPTEEQFLGNILKSKWQHFCALQDIRDFSKTIK